MNPDLSKYFQVSAENEFIIVATISYNRQSRFIRSLPPAVAQDKKFCQEIHAAFVKDTIEAIKENFESVEGNTKFESKLNLLSAVIGDKANQSKGLAWRPTNDALNNQAAHDQATLKAVKSKLEQELLASLQKDVAELEERLSTISSQIAQNSSWINRIIQDEEADPSPVPITESC